MKSTNLPVEEKSSSTKILTPKHSSPWIAKYKIPDLTIGLSRSVLAFKSHDSQLFKWLPLAMLLSALLGLIIGFLMRLRTERYTQREVMYIAILSDIFNSMLRCIFVPLLITNVFIKLSQLNFNTCIRITRQAFFLFFCSNLCGSLIGILVTFIMNPGTEARNTKFSSVQISNTTIIENLLYSIINTVTLDIPAAWSFQSATPEPMLNYSETRRITVKEAIYDIVHSVNISGLVFLIFVYGLCASRVRVQLKFLPRLIETFSELSILVINLIYVLSPVGILFSMIVNVLILPTWHEFFPPMAIYLIAIVIGIVIYSVLIIHILHFLITGRLSYKLFYHLKDIIIISLAVPSVFYTVPFSMAYLHKKNIDNRIVMLVIPLAVAFHKPASAIFYSVSSVFVAQASGFDVGPIDLFRLACLSFLCSFFESGYPRARIVFTQAAVQFIDTDASAISLTFPIQHIVNMFTNLCNVFCDCVCANAINIKMKATLRDQDRIRTRRKKIQPSVLSLAVRPR